MFCIILYVFIYYQCLNMRMYSTTTSFTASPDSERKGSWLKTGVVIYFNGVGHTLLITACSPLSGPMLACRLKGICPLAFIVTLKAITTHLPTKACYAPYFTDGNTAAWAALASSMGASCLLFKFAISHPRDTAQTWQYMLQICYLNIHVSFACGPRVYVQPCARKRPRQKGHRSAVVITQCNLV